jgi:SAM-dependent methyltransferase
MSNVDLFACCERYHQVVNEAIQQSPFPLTALMTTDDQLNSRRHVRQWVEDMAVFLAYLSKDDHVLDLGTGFGFSAVSFAYAGCRVKAIDIDDFMKDVPNHALARTAQEQLFYWPRVQEAFGGLTFTHYKNVMPFPDDSFDAIMAYGVLEHIPDALHASVMGEVRRVLKPGGHLFISFLPRKWALCENLAKWMGMAHHDRLWGDGEIKAFLRNHKFDILRFNRIAFSPQHPTSFSNNMQWLFDPLDFIARFTPLALLAHHFRIVVRKSG